MLQEWIESVDRGGSVTKLATVERGERTIFSDVSVAGSLLDRGDLLQMLDRAVTKPVTVISAPAGSGKTSLLRTWADRSANRYHVAFVSVDRDEHDANRFWGAALSAVRRLRRPIEPEMQPTETAALDGD